MDKNWTFAETLMGFGVFYLVFALVDVLGTKTGLEGSSIFFLAVVLGMGTLLLSLYIVVYGRSGMGNKIDIPSGNLPFDTMAGMLAGIALGGLGFLNVYLEGRGILGLFQSSYLRTNLMPEGLFGKLIFLILFVGVVPMVEELYFRGFMYPSLSRTLGILPGILLSGLLSSIFLAGSISYLYLVLAATVFGLLYETTERVYAGWVAHGAMNLILAATIFLKGVH